MSPTAENKKIGDLQCIVVDGGRDPRIAVVICHGYGADNQDLAPLAGEWLRVLGDHGKAFRFVFPDAPDTLAESGMPDGRAWWPISMMQMIELMQSDKIDKLHDLQPPEIDGVRESLCETVRLVLADLRGAATPLVLGGFSQGAMLTMDASLRGSIEPPQFLIQFSGSVICRAQWESEIGRLRNAYVFQSHGTVDPILPYAGAIVLHDLVDEAGIKNEFHSFVGPHTIDGESVTKTAAVMAGLAAAPS